MAVRRNYIKVPEGLRECIEGLTKQVLLEKPENIEEFAANHFETLLSIRESVQGEIYPQEAGQYINIVIKNKGRRRVHECPHRWQPYRENIPSTVEKYRHYKNIAKSSRKPEVCDELPEDRLGHNDNIDLNAFSDETDAITKIQAHVRGFLSRKTNNAKTASNFVSKSKSITVQTPQKSVTDPTIQTDITIINSTTSTTENEGPKKANSPRKKSVTINIPNNIESLSSIDSFSNDTEAITKIQAHVKGFLTRKSLNKIKTSDSKKNEVSENNILNKGSAEQQSDVKIEHQDDVNIEDFESDVQAVTKIQAHVRGFLTRKHNLKENSITEKETEHIDINDFKDDAQSITKIQAHVRGFLTRKNAQKINDDKSTNINSKGSQVFDKYPTHETDNDKNMKYLEADQNELESTAKSSAKSADYSHESQGRESSETELNEAAAIIQKSFRARMVRKHNKNTIKSFQTVIENNVEHINEDTKRSRLMSRRSTLRRGVAINASSSSDPDNSKSESSSHNDGVTRIMDMEVPAPNERPAAEEGENQAKQVTDSDIIDDKITNANANVIVTDGLADSSLLANSDMAIIEESMNLDIIESNVDGFSTDAVNKTTVSDNLDSNLESVAVNIDEKNGEKDNNDKFTQGLDESIINNVDKNNLDVDPETNTNEKGVIIEKNKNFTNEDTKDIEVIQNNIKSAENTDVDAVNSNEQAIDIDVEKSGEQSENIINKNDEVVHDSNLKQTELLNINSNHQKPIDDAVPVFTNSDENTSNYKLAENEVDDAIENSGNKVESTTVNGEIKNPETNINKNPHASAENPVHTTNTIKDDQAVCDAELEPKNTLKIDDLTVNHPLAKNNKAEEETTHNRSGSMNVDDAKNASDQTTGEIRDNHSSKQSESGQMNGNGKSIVGYGMAATVIAGVVGIACDSKLGTDNNLHKLDNSTVDNVVSTSITISKNEYVKSIVGDSNNHNISSLNSDLSSVESIMTSVTSDNKKLVTDNPGNIELNTVKLENENATNYMKSCTENGQVDIKDTVNNIESGIQDAPDNIESNIKDTADNIQSRIQEAADNIENSAEDTVDDIKSEIQKPADNIEGGIEDTVNNIESGIQDAADNIEGGIKDTVKNIESADAADNIEGDIKDTANNIESEVQDAADNIEGAKDTVNNVRIRNSRNADNIEDNIEGGIKDTVNNIESGIQDAADNIEGGIKDTVNNIESGIQDATDNVEGDIKDTANNIESGIQDAADNIEGGIKDTVNNIESRIQNAADNIEDNVERDIKDTVNNIESGIQDAADNIEGGIKDTVNNIESRIQNAADNIEGDIKDTVNNIESGIQDAADNIEGDIKDTVNNIESGIQDAADNIEGDIKDTVNNIESGIQDAADNIEGGIKDTVNNIESGIQDAADNIEGDIKDTVNNIESGIQDAADNIEGGIKDTVNNIESGIQDAADNMKKL
ncbi:putative uncharacterized protein DDB_G0282133 [Ctenocephalides felis]|uniref:putative uncharacterized protein DDB_G0282133 n=1 Tax=Ctenocephalides felis TaxID=7515 RepID=UPI000E6E4F97|nr:putative uncharacterized protein DDB_G0282133 [Ctenocephalides felis]